MPTKITFSIVHFYRDQPQFVRMIYSEDNIYTAIAHTHTQTHKHTIPQKKKKFTRNQKMQPKSIFKKSENVFENVNGFVKT